MPKTHRPSIIKSNKSKIKTKNYTAEDVIVRKQAARRTIASVLMLGFLALNFATVAIAKIWVTTMDKSKISKNIMRKLFEREKKISGKQNKL